MTEHVPGIAPVPLTPAIRLPEELSSEYLTFNRVLPLAIEDERVRVAAAGEPADHVREDLERLFNLPVAWVPASDSELDEAIQRVTAAAESVVALVRDLGAEGGAEGYEGASVADARGLALQPPVVRFVNLLLRDASDAGASDIHLESTRGGLRVRFRVDGVLTDSPAPPGSIQYAVISRIKLIAELDIAERRKPQDGRVKVRLAERELDLRIATIPSHHGESVTVRLLDHGGRPAALEELGMAPETFTGVRGIVKRSHGIVLVTGPTGSGKTTTLYAALSLRDRIHEKIMTVEDPVEYELDGVTQVPVHETNGMTFGQVLRSMVRHDPDVLMVGEMRDEETAEIAVRAAMTGHLVFSTLHTNDAVGAIPRLLNLGVPSHMIASTIEAVIAQRLVRRICDDCRTTYRPDPQGLALLSGRPAGAARLDRGKGCAACHDTGYRGRTGLFEMLQFNEAIRSAVARHDDDAVLRQTAVTHGMKTLRDDGWQKVQAGITTTEEVLRVVQIQA